MTQELSVVLINSFLLPSIITPIFQFRHFLRNAGKNCAPEINQERNLL